MPALLAVVDGAQSEKRAALRAGDPRQAGNVQLLVPALGRQCPHTSPALYVPELHRPVKAATCRQLAVTTQRNTPDPGRVALQSCYQQPLTVRFIRLRLRLPQPHRTIRSAGDQQAAVPR